ncbi:BRO family protein [Anaerococcus sp. NML200574]|uniref:phage antirepressor n=1 Tax=Anaerococcus sp. NML200574 TaxID=2954486 RepID=UPI00223824B8|nr:phage antirepressor KilAC domain-containing protein [Anaerococcus sp. NML200574]MCW6678198.1 BRO family protein [Anaerococcus sp. NML200574]
MKDLKIFDNEEFGQIRKIIDENSEPWFVGKDVAEILEYSSPANAIKKHIDEEDKGVTELMTPGGRQKMIIINESGLYSLIMSSEMKKAKRFKRWVTSEVLPSIRRDGGYIIAKENDSDEEILARAMIIAEKKIEKLKFESNKKDQIIGELRPKADYVDKILQNKSLIKVSSIAKDYGMSAYQMNKLLHDLRIQYKQGEQWLLYANIQDKGYTSSETHVYEKKDGTTDVRLLTKWTQKGRIFLYEELKRNGYLPMIERNAQ